MIDHDHNNLASRIANLIDSEWLGRRARELGVIERLRKVNLAAMIWSLALGFKQGARRSFTSLGRRYMEASRMTLSSSSWRARFTPEFARLMRECALHAIERQRRRVRSSLDLSGIEEVLALDATVLRLSASLADKFPATRTNHTEAAAKLHAVINVHDFKLERVKICEETRSDQQSYKRIGSWVQGRLLLMDLGYYNFNFFRRISERGGFFLSRLKVNANPQIIAEHDQGPGQRRSLIGLGLQEALAGLSRKEVEVTARFAVRKYAYKGNRSIENRDWRVIAVRNDEDGKYHTYITNLPRETLSVTEVEQMYRQRWQVEIFFKMLKSHGRIHHLETSNKAAVEAMIWASVLTAIASMEVLDAVRAEISGARRIPALRFQAIFEDLAGYLLDKIVNRLIPKARATPFEILIYKALDPNRNRLLHCDYLPFS